MNLYDEELVNELVNAILWKLYIIHEDRNEKKYQDMYNIFVKEHPDRVLQICQALAAKYQQVFQTRLGLLDKDFITSQWKSLETAWINSLELLLMGQSLRKDEVNALYLSDDEGKKFQDSFRDVIRDALAHQDRSPSDNQEVGPQPTAQWKYLPVPENEPDKHNEFDARSLTTPEGLKLIGARVRGKKHKHEGTNCDDWFEFAVSGPWTIIAVSDGAGSKKFSRVGAKVSCFAAVQHLAEDLQNHKINERESWSADTFKRNETTGVFAEEDLEFVQKALHKAMQVAYEAVQKAAAERNNSFDHAEILGNRRLEIRDLSATLLLAVHTTVKYKEKDYSLVLTCQVGDGMTAAVYQEDRKGKIKLLGTPDSGEFAGQTDFLTSKEKLSPDNLMRKTFPLFRPLQALMMMTDGVADDYFPPDPGMLQLYGNLLLNRVIDFPQPTDDEIAEKLCRTNLGSAPAVKEAKDNFGSEVERITYPEDIPQKVWIRSVADYAKELRVSVAEVVAAPELLAAGSSEEQMWEQAQDKPPKEKLQIWLDSYKVRGSFDDRTLVVLYREVV